MDLALYELRDSTDSNNKDLSGLISSNGFLAVDWSNRLNNDGDIIRLLLKSDGSNIDRIAYGSSGNDAPMSSINQTSGRTPDGNTSWAVLLTSTKGSTNNSSSIVPTVTPTPTTIPTPTKTPTPIPTPTPSKTPTPTPTPKLTPTPTPSPKLVASPTPTPVNLANVKSKAVALISKIPSIKIPKIDSDEESTASHKDVLGASSGKNSVEVLGERKTVFPWWMLFFVAGGGIILTCCGILLFRKYKEGKNLEF